MYNSNGIFYEAMANCGDGDTPQTRGFRPFYLKSLPKHLKEVVACVCLGSSMEPLITDGQVGIFYKVGEIEADWQPQVFLVVTKNSGLQVKWVTKNLNDEGMVSSINLVSLNKELRLKDDVKWEDEVAEIYKFYDRKDPKDFFDAANWSCMPIGRK